MCWWSSGVAGGVLWDCAPSRFKDGNMVTAIGVVDGEMVAH